MKTGDKMKNYMQIALEGKNSLTVYGTLDSFISEVEALENDLEYYKHGVEELRKENEAMKKNIILVLEILSGGKNDVK